MLTEDQINKGAVIAKARTLMENFQLNRQIADKSVDLGSVDYSQEKVDSSPKSNPIESSFTHYVQLRNDVEQVIKDIDKISPNNSKLLRNVYMTTFNTKSPEQMSKSLNVSKTQYYKMLNGALYEFGLVSKDVPIEMN